MTVEGLVKALQGAGFDTHPEHLLDALWLGSLGVDLTSIALPARDMPERTTQKERQDHLDFQSDAGIDNSKVPDSTKNKPKDPSPRQDPLDGKPSPVYGAGDVAAEDVTIPAAGVILPSARTLPDRLPLIRAMRAFRREFPSHATELDEPRTAELTAESWTGVEGCIFPVLRPRNERWYEAHVVVEDDPTIDLWNAPLREFTQLLRDAGVFRLVRSWHLRLNSSTPTDLQGVRLESPAGGFSSPASIGGARQLIFFASHGLSQRWVDGTYARLLKSWSAGSAVLLHLQPRSRWSQTMLGEPNALANNLQPGSPNSALDIEPIWWRLGPDANSIHVARLPAIEIEPTSLESWARMLMGMGRQVEVFLLDSDIMDPEPPINTATPASTEKDVQRALASLHERSPAAYQLAIMLASAPFTLPVARLVQEVTQNADTDFTVLAELMLSGIVAPRAGDKTTVRETTYFMIREQARPHLLRSLRGADADALANSLDERISKHLSDIAGRDIQFSALLAHPEGQARLPIWAREFAHITTALHNRPGAALSGRTWRDVVDGLGNSVIGGMSRLASARVALSSDVVSEKLWRHVDDPRLVRLDENKELRFVPTVAEYLRHQIADAPYRGLTILWVDDNPGNNERIASSLTAAGATVIEVLDTDQALAHPRLAECDVIASDMSRHGNHRAGYDLISGLRSRGLSAPVVIFAAYTGSSPSRRRAVVEAGAFGATNEVSEVHSLIKRAAVASVLRKGSLPRTDIESRILEEIPYEKRDIKDIPSGEFCTLDEIYQSLRNTNYLQKGDRIIDSLLVFETSKQRSWLIATTRLLLFILDDQNTRQKRRLCQRGSLLSDASELTASIDGKGVATFRIGGSEKRAWYFSPSLFESPRDLEAAIQKLIGSADLARREPGVSSAEAITSAPLMTDREHASAALLRIDIECDDEVVLDIVIEAARFRPAPGYDESISLSRVFCGALMTARALRRSGINRERILRAFEATLSSAGWSEISNDIMSQFQRGDAREARDRLDLSFSESARNALQRAGRRDAHGDDISASSIVRALITPQPNYQKSLLYNKLSNLPALRTDIEKRVEALDFEGLAIFASASMTTHSFVLSESGSVFGNCVAEGLSGEASVEGGVVTLRHLFEFVQHRLMVIGNDRFQQTPRLDVIGNLDEFPITHPGSTSALFGRRRALMIASNNYSASDMTLPHNEESVRAIANLLAKFGEFEITLLLGQEVTLKNVYAALDAIVETAELGDPILVYFAGHGVLTKNSQYRLLMSDSDGRNLGTMLSTEDLRDALRRRNNGPTVLFLDASYSGTMGSSLLA